MSETNELSATVTRSTAGIVTNPSVNPVPAAVDESAPLRHGPTSGGGSSGGDAVYSRPCCDRSTPQQRRNLTIVGVLGVLALIGLVTAIGLSSGEGNDNSPSEADYVNQFLSSQNTARLRATMAYYTNESHIAGSPMDYDRALYTQQKMLAYGIPDVQIETFNVLLSYPLSRYLALVSGAAPFVATLKEDVLPSDPTSGKPSVDTFLSYSASGNVTAPLVYANYGQLSDYEQLASMGVSVAGCVVIARYGEIFRGNIVSNAEYHGAVGVLIYSDPFDDGAVKGGTYPNSPGWRPPSGVQRGTIWNGNGDPLTPGYPSIDIAPRITMAQAGMANYSYGTPLSKIPSLPISYGDATPLLKALGGQPVPTGQSVVSPWQGGLNFPYHIGGSGVATPIVVNLHIEMLPTRTNIWNVIGKIPGSDEPDRMVILGNHRDAWTFGAGDPNSGSTTLLEVAAGFGVMLSNGWLPRRTIVLSSWDAEEYALIGSVEHCELHEKTLMAGAIAYLNVDVGVSTTATLEIGGTPSLAGLIRAVTKSLPAPAPYAGKTLYDMWAWSQDVAGEPPVTLPVLDAADLGTGSDYGGFVQHLGVPSIDFRFANNPNNSYEGVYHSNYDSNTWITSAWADPDFIFHASLAQVWGLVAIRLADSPLLPFAFTEYANALNSDIAALAASYGPGTAANLDFTSLAVAAANVVKTATKLDAALVALGDASGLTSLQLRVWNDKLSLAERAFLYLQGMPGREWYRHTVWVAGLYDVYGSTAFSMISDAMAVNDVTDAQINVQMAAISLTQFDNFLNAGKLF